MPNSSQQPGVQTDGPLQDLRRAAARLSADPLWRELLAENLYWASPEGFLQSSLLGAFNAVSDDFISDRERAVPIGNGTVNPDLVVMHRSVHGTWWRVRNQRVVDSAHLGRLACAMIELKVAWTKGDARGSAILSQKAPKIAGDITKLREVSVGRENTRFYVGVLVSGFHDDHTSRKTVDAALEDLKVRVRGPEEVRGEGTSVFLDDYFNPKWRGLLEDDRTVSSVMWILPVQVQQSLTGSQP